MTIWAIEAPELSGCHFNLHAGALQDLTVQCQWQPKPQSARALLGQQSCGYKTGVAEFCRAVQPFTKFLSFRSMQEGPNAVATSVQQRHPEWLHLQ